MSQTEIANKYEVDLKSKLYDLQKEIVTRSEFLKYFYQILGKFKTQKDAFDSLNAIYFLLFAEEQFASYDAFRMYRNKNF